jgi:hypothetical protein
LAAADDGSVFVFCETDGKLEPVFSCVDTAQAAQSQNELSGVAGF